jgi:cystathionine beta-lyase
MDQSPRFDVTVEELRATGGLKWSLHPEAIGAFVAEMDFGTAPPVAAAMHRAVDVGLLGYLPEHLAARLAGAWSGWAADRYGWQVAPERVRPLADVMAGLEAVVQHFSEPDAPVILPTPAYMPFLVVPPILGRRVIEVPMRTEAGRAVYDLEALQAAYDAGGSLLVLCNPHNPIGRVLEPAEMEAVAAVTGDREA